jgi:hypothetical protein
MQAHEGLAVKQKDKGFWMRVQACRRNVTQGSLSYNLRGATGDWAIMYVGGAGAALLWSVCTTP